MTTMKAAFSTAYGAPVQVGELPRPVASADQVLIKVHAASLNPIDVKRNAGALRQLRPQAFPMRQGYDVAGVVEDVGSEVTAFKKGDEVYARVDETDLGTVAEYVAAKAAHTAIKPANVSFVQAAAIPLAALTALQAFKRAGLSKGAKVFIPAGAGGVGHMAIQIAKYVLLACLFILLTCTRAYFEAGTVASTASTNKVAFVQSLGADIVVDYKKESYWDKLEHDYDFVLDTTGDLENELKILKVNKDAKVHSIALLPDSDEAARKFNATPGFFVRCFLDFKVPTPLRVFFYLRRRLPKYSRRGCINDRPRQSAPRSSTSSWTPVARIWRRSPSWSRQASSSPSSTRNSRWNRQPPPSSTWKTATRPEKLL